MSITATSPEQNQSSRTRTDPASSFSRAMIRQSLVATLRTCDDCGMPGMWIWNDLNPKSEASSRSYMVYIIYICTCWRMCWCINRRRCIQSNQQPKSIHVTASFGTCLAWRELPLVPTFPFSSHSDLCFPSVGLAHDQAKADWQLPESSGNAMPLSNRHKEQSQSWIPCPKLQNKNPTAGMIPVHVLHFATVSNCTTNQN
jgi:hypothetical protein